MAWPVQMVKNGDFHLSDSVNTFSCERPIGFGSAAPAWARVAVVQGATTYAAAAG